MRFEIVVPLLGVVVVPTLRCKTKLHVCGPYGVIGVHAAGKARINEVVVAVTWGARVFFSVCKWVESAVSKQVAHHIVEKRRR